MRVSKNSSVPNIAGALAGSLRSGDSENLDVMGVQCVYIAVKALLLLSPFLKPNGIKPMIEITPIDVKVGKNEVERTVIRFTIHPVPIGDSNGDEEE